MSAASFRVIEVFLGLPGLCSRSLRQLLSRSTAKERCEDEKVLGSSGSGTVYNVTQGVIHVVKEGARITNNSYGNYVYSALQTPCPAVGGRILEPDRTQFSFVFVMELVVASVALASIALLANARRSSRRRTP